MSAVARFARFSGTLLLLVGGCAALGSPPQSASPSPASREQITILYDAFGKPGPMQKDWGYAALVEYGGKRLAIKFTVYAAAYTKASTPRDASSA